MKVKHSVKLDISDSPFEELKQMVAAVPSNASNVDMHTTTIVKGSGYSEYCHVTLVITWEL